MMNHAYDQQIIDPEQVETLATTAGVDITKSILDAFWSSSDELISVLSKCIQDQNLEEVYKAAHGLKGSSSNIGAIEMAKRAREIEGHARDGDLSAVQSCFEKLDQDVSKARDEFTKLFEVLAVS